DDCEGVVANFPVRTQVIWPDEVSGIDILLRYKLVDFDGAGGFQRDVFKLFFRHLYVGVGINLESLRDLVVGNLLTRVGIDLQLLDAVAGLFVDLVERDFLGIRSSRIQSYRTSNQG